MKRDIRRKNRQLTERNEMLEILDREEYGILSTVDRDGEPYGIPISFARKEDRLVFHCAPEGRKLDCFRFQPLVSFCVVDRTRIVPGKFTTEYESVIVTGTVVIVEDPPRKVDDLVLLVQKYDPEHLSVAPAYIEASLHRTGIFELQIESMTGKAHRSRPDGSTS